MAVKSPNMLKQRAGFNGDSRRCLHCDGRGDKRPHQTACNPCFDRMYDKCPECQGTKGRTFPMCRDCELLRPRRGLPV